MAQYGVKKAGRPHKSNKRSREEADGAQGSGKARKLKAKKHGDTRLFSNLC